MGSSPRITGLGALNMDHIYRVKRLLSDGEIAVQNSGSFPGGSAANTIYGLAKLGIQSGFSGATGNDDSGKQLIDDFRQVGIDTNHIIVKKGAPTGSVFCINNARIRSLYVSPGANSYLTAEDIDISYVNNADYLHMASFVDNAQFKLAKNILRQLSHNVRFSFAPGALYADRGLKALSPFLRNTAVLFLNRNEIENITGKHFTRGTEICLEMGCHIVVVTLGKGIKKNGLHVVAYVRSEQDSYWISAGEKLNYAIADTTGAGDAFCAGFLYGLLQNMPAWKCGQIGNAVAQIKIQYHGARAGLPDKAHLEEYYARIYQEYL
jgi:ribokinase